jgi:hypothetical protein
MTMVIIPRSAWGARYDNGAGPAPLPATEVWLHHSAGLWPDLVWLDANRDGVEDDEAAAMRTLESIGEQRFGAGISYTFVIMPSGRIYEGHGVDRQGTHTGGRNDTARAICWAGNYMIHKSTAEQLRSTAWLLQQGARRGWWRTATLRGGHRDVRPMTGDSIVTDCPGDHAYAAIRGINGAAAGPAITDTTDTKEDDMSGYAYAVPLRSTASNEIAETVVALPWRPGVTNVTDVWCAITTGYLPMYLQVAHWRLKDAAGNYAGVADFVPNGTTLDEHTQTSRQAPTGAYALVVDHRCIAGGSVLVEAR